MYHSEECVSPPAILGPGFTSTSPDVISSSETTAMDVRTRAPPRLCAEWCRGEEIKEPNHEVESKEEERKEEEKALVPVFLSLRQEHLQ